jgi:hypothetical protein
MIKLYSSFVKLLAFLWVVFTLQSCEPTQPGSWKNDLINNGDRKKFHQLNDELFKQLKVNDVKQLENIMSQEFINSRNKNRQVEVVSNRAKTADYDLLDEYYVVNRYTDADTIQTSTKGPGSYMITYMGITHQMYIAFFVPKTGINKYMITAVYCKYDYGWKLSELGAEPYTINGKTTPELFEQAKASYNKNYLVDALYISESAFTCARPSSVWKYNNEDAFTSFYNKLLKEASEQYRFPVAIKQVATHPRIIRILNQTTPEGVFPMIYYQSSIKLSDTTAIKQENEQVKQVIDQTLPGIDQNKKYLLYSVFNEVPNAVRSVNHFDITHKLK